MGWLTGIEPATTGITIPNRVFYTGELCCNKGFRAFYTRINHYKTQIGAHFLGEFIVQSGKRIVRNCLC
jgi:hypothetical protein